MSAAPTIGVEPTVEPTTNADSYAPGTDPRQRRLREVRAKTIAIPRLGKRRLQLMADELGDTSDLPRRPRTRAECKDGPRPCPFVSCQHHLYLDIVKSGSLKLNFPDVEADQLEQLPETCALDVAARGGARLEEVGAVMNITRERVRQIEEKALAKLERKKEGLRDYRDHAPDHDWAEPIAPQLPIVRLPLAGDVSGAVSHRTVADFVSAKPSPPPAVLPPAEFVVSPATEEVPMARCKVKDCEKEGRPGPAEHPETDGMCLRHRREAINATALPKAKPAPGTTLVVKTAGPGSLMEQFQIACEAQALVEQIGWELCRAIAARIQNGGSGS